MSALKMKQLVEAQNVWDGFAQAGAMTLLCWYHSEATDCASVSFGRIARWAGVEKRYVQRLMEVLELEKEACVNLGPDPELGGRNRWKVTIDRAVAKVRREAGIADDMPLARIERRRVRRRPPSTGVIPGSPPSAAPEPLDPVENDLREIIGGPGIIPPVIPGSSPGDPRITPPVIPGSPQSAKGFVHGVPGSLSTAADAAAPAASPSLEFQLYGEALHGPQDRAAKHALDARRKQLRERIQRHVRWLLEHPLEAAAYNGGAAIVTEGDLRAAARNRCAQKRIPGYGEGDVLVNVCASELHLFKSRRAVFDNSGEITRLRDLRTPNSYQTTRGTRRKR